MIYPEVRMKRREFGRRILETAAALGLRHVSMPLLSSLGAPLLGCAADSSDPRRYDLRPVPLTADTRRVAIVGSGYGAAVTAMRLTEAGIPVTLFEMGQLWDTPGADGKIFCSSAEPDDRAMWFKDSVEAVISSFGGMTIARPVPRAAGVMDVVGPETMRVSLGRGVGGGSLVNLAVYVEPVREMLRNALPDVNADEMYDTFYPRARQLLQAHTVPWDILGADCYQYSRTGVAGAIAIGAKPMRCVTGYDYDYMREEIAGTVPLSAVGGEGGFGNNYGKQSLDKTYLAEAMGTGLLTIHALHEVTKLARTNDGYVLATKQIDKLGNVLSQSDFPCSHVFLCAGSIGTSQLLTRARERGDLPDLNSAVGTGWGPNSDIFIARDNAQRYPTGVSQCIVSSSAFHTRDAHGKPVFSMIIPCPFGMETHISFNIVMADNPEAGHFIYDSATDKVELVWADGQNDPAVRSARDVFDRMNDAVGSTYNETLFSGRPFGDRSSYHPVGGCPLGRATDAYGRVPHYPGLYVMDGSLIPLGLGANPSLTITALSERNLERIVAEDFGV
jgi:cholesterol oxidase